MTLDDPKKEALDLYKKVLADAEEASREARYHLLLAEKLEAERDAYRKALEQIADGRKMLEAQKIALDALERPE